MGKVKAMSTVNLHKAVLLEEFYLDSDGITVRRAKDGWGKRWKQGDKVEGYKLCSYGYRGVHIPRTRTTVNLSHLILLLRGVEIPEGVVTDHIDGDSLNNSVDNLRLVPQVLNTRNRKKHSNNTTGYNGITYNKVSNSFLVRLALEGKRKYLGQCFTLEDAIKLRDSYNEERKQSGFTSRHGLEGVTTIPAGSTLQAIGSGSA